MPKKKKTEIAQVGPISDAIRRTAEKHRKINTRVQTYVAEQFRQLYPQLEYAMEFGFKCCEKGMNLEAARLKLAELYTNELK